MINFCLSMSRYDTSYVMGRPLPWEGTKCFLDRMIKDEVLKLEELEEAFLYNEDEGVALARLDVNGSVSYYNDRFNPKG